MDRPNYINVKVDNGQLEYAKNIQHLLSKRLDTNLPAEYEIPDIIIEQAMFLYIDTMEKYYRLEGKDWGDFYEKFNGVIDVPRKLEEFREHKIRPLKNSKRG